MVESASGDGTERIVKCIDDVAAALTGQRECYFKIISTEGDSNSPDIEIISDSSKGPSSDEIDCSMPIFPLRYPVDDPAELDDSRHINMHLASERRDRTCTEQTDKAFDRAVLRVVEHLYDELGFTTDILDVDERFWRAMHLYHARGFDSISALIEHLDMTPRTASAIGFANDQSPRKDWYYNRDVFDDWEIEERIREIVKRAVHGVWRAGWHVPDEVRRYWDVDKESIEKAHPTEETRREAIRNWVRLLINDAADSLDFDRDVNVTHDIREFISLFAHSAGLDAGIAESHRTAGWLADDDHIPSGSRTSELINQFHDSDNSGENTFPVEEVNDEFIQLHESVLDRCAEYGILPDSIDVAFDLIEIPWYGYRDLDATIGERDTNSDSFPKWTLSFLSAVDTDIRLCLGVEYVSSKSQYPDALNRQLEFADRNINLGRFYMDSDGHNGEIIDTVRRYTNNYIIKAEKRGKSQNTVGYWLRHAPPGEPLFRTAVDATSATPRPNAAFIPNDSVSNSTTSNTDVSAASGSTQVELGSVANDDRSATAADTGGSLYTHTPYFIDADVDREDIPSDVSDYSDRWAAEVTADELQNHVHPVTQSSKPAQRAYLSNISMLLLNWHTLINNARSPKLGLSLNVTHQELLLAIQDIGFSGIGKTR